MEGRADVLDGGESLITCSASRRIEFSLEKVEELLRDPRILNECVRQRGSTRHEPHLERIPGEASQNIDLTPVQSSTHDQSVQRVADRVASASCEESLGEQATNGLDIQYLPFLRLNGKDVDRRFRRSVAADLIRLHGHNTETGVLQNRHEVGKNQHLAAQEQLQLGRTRDTCHGVAPFRVAEPHGDQAPVCRHGLELTDVHHCDIRLRRRLILTAERIAIVRRETPRFLGWKYRMEPRMNPVGPCTNEPTDGLFERVRGNERHA